MELMSKEIGNLMASLSKVQAVLEGAVKDSKNPFFKSNYADLNSVWEACKEPLSRNGFAVTQTFGIVEGKQCIVTTLGHSSGEWLRGFLEIPQPEKWDKNANCMVKGNAQDLGSAITYCRRYALAAIVGVCAVDDDAEAAVGRSQYSQSKPQQQKNNGYQQKPAQMKQSSSAEDATDEEIEGEFYERFSDLGDVELLKLYVIGGSSKKSLSSVKFMEGCLDNEKSFRDVFARWKEKKIAKEIEDKKQAEGLTIEKELAMF